jgi:RNA polymerase sigma factor (sigma-70 family)
MVDELLEQCHEETFSDQRPNATVRSRTSAREGRAWGHTLATAAEQSAVGLIGAQVADADLVAGVRAGDDGAFAQLYQRYHGPVAAYVYGMVKDHGRAEDITQDAFISALRRMQKTDRPIVFRPWIYEIAKNACIDQFRRSRRKDEVSYDGGDVLEAAHGGRWLTTSPGPAAAIDRKQSLDHLCGAFGGLSEAHHQILVMREFEGLSYQEIGERLGMTGAAVESTLFRARKRLAEEYGELVSGKRCLQVQALLTESPGTALGGRDGRRVGRHISHCAPCRRHARRAGLTVAERRPLRLRVAAFLPLPAIFRRRGDADDAGASALLSSQAPTLSHVSASLGPIAEPLAGWVKAAALAAAIAVAGIGTGVATKRIDVPGLNRLPVVGGSATPQAPAHRAADTRRGVDELAPAGVDGPVGVPRGTTDPSIRPIALPDGWRATSDAPATPGGAEPGATGVGGPPATSPVPASGARRDLGNQNPSLVGAPPTGGAGSGDGTVPRPREAGQEVRDTVNGAVPGGLPRRPEAKKSRPVSGLKDAPKDLPSAPKLPDPSSVLPTPDPSLPPTTTPNLPPTQDPGDPLGGGLGGLLGG